jgi:peroxin-12
LGYGFGLTKYYSPTLQLAKVKLTYAKDPSPIITSSSTTSRIFSVASQIISNGLFLLQLVDWWNDINGSKQKTANNITCLPSTVPVRTQSTIGQRRCLLCRQPCHVPTVIIGSGYVYCHMCISEYIEQFNRCPTSQKPVTNKQLIKIY